MPVYVDDFIDHALITTDNINGYSLPSLFSSNVEIFEPGETIGTIYSYIVDQNGYLWWMIYPYNDSTQKPFYVFNDYKKLSVPDVNESLQNINTNKPLPVVDTTPPFGSGIGDAINSILKALPTILIIAGVAIIVPPIIRSLDKK